MSAAVDLVKSLSAAGVEFSTDGIRVRWRNSDGRVTPEIVAALAAEKATVIEFLAWSGDPEGEAKADFGQRIPPRSDPDLYADALRLHGPMSYGVAMWILGWGATRAGQAETALRAAGRIRFNKLGRAVLVDG